jgi:hypothetical protein
MSRTHDVTISGFDLDQLERELAAVTKERDTALFDLEFRRDLYKVQEQQLNNARNERDEYRGLLIELYNDINVIHSGNAVAKLSRLMRDENYN